MQQCQNLDIMTHPQKRVAIARDVIKQVRTKQLIAQRGIYVDTPDNQPIESRFDNFSIYNDEEQINQILIKSGVPCQVCARGAIFIAGLKRFNNLTVGDFRKSGYGNFNEIQREQYEKNFFEPQQLTLIERCFESYIFPLNSKIILYNAIGLDYMNCSYDLKYDSLQNVCAYFRENLETDQLLIKIANNIIRNNGDFIIPRKYWRRAKVSDKISGEINRVLLHKTLI